MRIRTQDNKITKLIFKFRLEKIIRHTYLFIKKSRNWINCKRKVYYNVKIIRFFHPFQSLDFFVLFEEPGIQPKMSNRPIEILDCINDYY